MALLNRLLVPFQIYNGSTLVTSSYSWTTVLNAKSSLMLTIHGSSVGSLSSLTLTDDTVIIVYVDGTTTYTVTITQNHAGTGTHLVDFSNLEVVGEYSLFLWDGYAFREIKGFKATSS